MDLNCIFCKIINGDIPSKRVYEDDHVIAFHDIEPQAPLHVLFISKEHIRRFSKANDNQLLYLFHAVRAFASEENLEEDGYRLVINTGDDGGQSVDHLHIHLLAKRKLQWPPG